MKKILAAAVATTLSAVPALAVPAVTTGNVNFREGPGTNYSTLGTLSEGTTVDLSNCDESGTWCSVTADGRNGYVSGSYLQLVESETTTDQPAAAPTAAATDPTAAPLSEDELEVLVARIALYPDELVAVISGASLYPLQIVEAARFLEDYAKDSSLQPKSTWDGSIVSLLNYPEIVKMMSDDLDWTRSLGDALAYQQKDVLVAIQQLRDEAVAKGIIKTDDKIEVTEQDDNVVITSANPETVYVPQYEPEMLYVPDYAPVPIAYYPDPYPSYYYPTATFFAGAVTGAIWAAAVDWDDWGVWGGHWDGGDIDIDCNNCFNNRDFNGKVNFNDVDWKNVDRSKINIDRNQFNNIDRTEVRNNIKANTNNSIGERATSIRDTHNTVLPGRTGHAQDVRKSTLDGLRGGDIAANRPAGGGGLNLPAGGATGINRPAGAGPAINRPAGDRPAINRPAADRPAVSRPSGDRQAARPEVHRPSGNVSRPATVSRPSGQVKPAARIDTRPRAPSGLGHVGSGRPQAISSSRGHQSMGGGRMGGGGHRSMGGGGRRR